MLAFGLKSTEMVITLEPKMLSTWAFYQSSPSWPFTWLTSLKVIRLTKLEICNTMCFWLRLRNTEKPSKNYLTCNTHQWSSKYYRDTTPVILVLFINYLPGEYKRYCVSTLKYPYFTIKVKGPPHSLILSFDMHCSHDVNTTYDQIHWKCSFNLSRRD